APLPDSDPQIVAGTYLPSNYGTTPDDFPPPAPPPPYVTNLTVFRGTDPNGTWSLYVVDDQPENKFPTSTEGFIADGWTLSIITGGPIRDPPLTAVGQPSSVVVGNHVTYSLTVSNRGPAASTALLQSRLPPGVGFVSATASRGGCTNDNGVVTC